MGKITIEKLLRSCPEIDTIYCLARAKKGKTAQERIDALLDNLPLVLDCGNVLDMFEERQPDSNPHRAFFSRHAPMRPHFT